MKLKIIQKEMERFPGIYRDVYENIPVERRITVNNTEPLKYETYFRGEKKHIAVTTGTLIESSRYPGEKFYVSKITENCIEAVHEDTTQKSYFYPDEVCLYVKVSKEKKIKTVKKSRLTQLKEQGIDLNKMDAVIKKQAKKMFKAKSNEYF